MRTYRLFKRLLILLLLASVAAADTFNEKLEDAGKSATRIRQGVTLYHYSVATVSVDTAIPTEVCKGGLDIWFNPDFDGTNVTATYTLYNCPRTTAKENFVSECIPLNFDPDGGGANTNIMTDSNDSLHIWSARVRFFGATITNASSDQAQATIRCLN